MEKINETNRESIQDYRTEMSLLIHEQTLSRKCLLLKLNVTKSGKTELTRRARHCKILGIHGTVMPGLVGLAMGSHILTILYVVYAPLIF